MAVICRNNLGNIILARTSRAEGRSPTKGEARAARMACQMAGLFSAHDIILEGDCEVNQVVDGTAAVDWAISGEVTTIQRLLQDHPTWSFNWIPREANVAAHNLVKWCSSSSCMAAAFLLPRFFRKESDCPEFILEISLTHPKILNCQILLKKNMRRTQK